MAHPFFDTVVFPWHLDEATRFHQVLCATVVQSPHITDLYRRSNGSLVLQRQNLSPLDAWTEVLDLLSRQRMLRNLCDLVIADARLQDAHAATKAVIEYQDPTLEGVLSNGELFVDREVLRGSLTDLASQSTRKCVLLVRGTERVGKTWTRHLVNEQVKSLNADQTQLYRDLVGTVGEVIEHLFDKLGAPDRVPPVDESDIAWYRKVCLRLQAVAADRKKVLWIIVDDIGEYPPETGERLDKRIRQFFNQFVVHMGSDSFAPWFRLVLLDYPATLPLPTNWDKNILIDDKPSLDDVDEDAIAMFLKRAARRKKKQISDEEAKRLAGDVVAKVAAALAADNTLSRLQVVNDQLKAVNKTL